MPHDLGKDSTCSIARALDVVGDAWTLLIVRDALIKGSTRFQEFMDGLGIAPNILTKRLNGLVAAGIMTRRSYRAQGARVREEYVLTESGRGLSLVIGALAAWGHTHLPHPEGDSPRFVAEETGAATLLAFVTEDGRRMPPERLIAHRSPDIRVAS